MVGNMRRGKYDREGPYQPGQSRRPISAFIALETVEYSEEQIQSNLS